VLLCSVAQVHSKGKVLAKDVDMDKSRAAHPRVHGADLQNLMNEAAIFAARRNLKEISMDEISDALERIIAGPEKTGAMVSPEKRRLVAYHGEQVVHPLLSSRRVLRYCFCSRGLRRRGPWSSPRSAASWPTTVRWTHSRAVLQ